MPIKDYTTQLLNLQGVFVTNLDEDASSINLYVSSDLPKPTCEHCNHICNIHDYRTQTIKLGKLRYKNLFIVLKKRRFKCPICNKIHTEKLPFIAKGHRIAKSIFFDVFEKTKEERNMTSIAKELNISVNTVIRYFDTIDYVKPKKAPKSLAIDEFKGNTGGFKYNVVITDPSTHTVLDILPTRDKAFLIDYFYSLENKENTHFFHQDMWQIYKDVGKASFKNANIVADKYHFARQVNWAMENVRKREQKRMSKDNRLFFKRSKSLLKKDRKKLTLEEQEYLFVMFSNSYDLDVAYQLKEEFKEFLKCKDYEEGKRLLTKWILVAEESNLPEFKPAITAFRHWYKEICNSKLTDDTNGFTEGINNKIKVLKRVSYGMRNFKRFRNRILHMCNKKVNVRN